MTTNNLAINLCNRLLDPEDLGHAVTPEVRQETMRVLQLMGLRSTNTTTPIKVYLAGPMTGLPEFNFPTFYKAAEILKAKGFIVENPAEHAKNKPQSSWSGYMRQAIKILVDCDEVYLLPGWGHSSGANEEHNLARILNMPINYPEDWCPDEPYPWN